MTTRLAEADRLSAVLAELDDDGLQALIDTAEREAIGIGGSTMTVRLGGGKAFVKRLPLTAAEQADPNATTSRLDLPFVSHYGLGSLSHAVGRELTAHQLTSGWVRSGAAAAFPLLLGWRVLGAPCAMDLSEFDGDAAPRRWGRYWPEVEKRLAAMQGASVSLLLFLEYVPETLGSRLRRSVAEGTAATVFPDAVEQLVRATSWMGRQGFQHFDVHPGNILVHEGRLLLTDFGLALHRGFDLTAEEEAGMAAHKGYDHDCSLMHLFHWTLFELGYTSARERLDLLRHAATDPAAPALAQVRAVLGTGADLIALHAGTAVRMTDMFAALLQDATGPGYDNTHDTAATDGRSQ
jgi:hypothetical protein